MLSPMRDWENLQQRFTAIMIAASTHLACKVLYCVQVLEMAGLAVRDT